MPEIKEQIVLRLENLVRKVMVQSVDASDVDCRIFAPQTQGNPYIIEISKDKFVRRVPVDVVTARHLKLSQPDPVLMRDVRTAILAVSRLAKRR